MYYCRVYLRLLSEMHLKVDVLCTPTMGADEIISRGINQVLEDMGKGISPALKARVKDKKNWHVPVV